MGPITEKKILVAEDSPTVRRLVSARLAADGYDVVEAEDGEQALELAVSERPAALVLDKVMPKLDGFEVVRRPIPPTATLGTCIRAPGSPGGRLRALGASSA
jgi:CheY-like chemotaxis protein